MEQSLSPPYARYLRSTVYRPKPEGITPTPGHLGGGRKKSHSDPGALAFLVERLGISSMLDVGCGAGCMVTFARENGIDAVGIDGDVHANPDIVWDFEQGPCPDLPEVDLVWSCEFVEHVEERFAPNFIETFRRGRWLAMTFAPPGKDGRHHVNCRDAAYWIAKLGEAGLRHDAQMTAELRFASRMESVRYDGTLLEARKRFVVDHGLMFERLADGDTPT